MNKLALFARMRHLTGRLKAASGIPENELVRFERTLARHLLADPNLTISGNRLSHEGAADVYESDEALTERFRHLADLFEVPPPAPGATAAPRVFRRETAFRSGLLGNSVPEWGLGMAPTRSFGPFVSEPGLPIWFDLFQPIKLVGLHLAGVSGPLLRVPIWGAITGRRSYRIEAGSVWIASDLIARVSALKGYYTGLTAIGGTIELSKDATMSSGQIVIDASTSVSLHLELSQPSPPGTPQEAGADAAAAVVALPRTFDLSFHARGSSVHVGPSSCSVFGCETELRYEGQQPIWWSVINQILIPCPAEVRGDAQDEFRVETSQSALCRLNGVARVDAGGTGWLLPAVKADPMTLGDAAGAGALCVTLGKGLKVDWKGVKSSTTLTRPSIIVEPGLVTVLDFTASNATGKLRWTLWRNANTKHSSQVTLRLGKTFPFAFVSSAANSEGVFCFCGPKAELDRPVDANGSPFKVESSIAFATILQTGPTYRALLLDNDLLFDGTPNNPAAYRRHSLSLRNALFVVGRPRSLALFGELEQDDRIARGTLALTHDIHLYLPTLPDPYAASYTPFLRDPAAIEIGHPRQALSGFVRWPDPPGAAADDPVAPRARVDFKLSPMDVVREPPPASRNFRTGVATFNRNLLGYGGEPDTPLSGGLGTPAAVAPARSAPAVDLSERVARSVRSGALRIAVAELEANPLLGHIRDKSLQVEQTLTAASRQSDVSPAPDALFAVTPAVGMRADPSESLTRALFGRDLVTLLDVSSRADQMGVSLGPAFRVGRDERGDASLQPVDAVFAAVPPGPSGLPLQIVNMDVVTTARNVRAVTLPQISWEPVWNIPLQIEGPPSPQDLITVAPGLVLYDNDGIPTRIVSESPHPVPIAPLPVTRHFLRAFRDDQVPRPLHSAFTLPFALVAQADFDRSPRVPPEKNARLDFNMPHFDDLRGGLQIKALAPASKTPATVSPSFPGWTLQLDNIRWSLFGLPLPGSTLGATVRDIFNNKFRTGGDDPRVPLERIELSGYGASIFSNWLNADAVVADVSQVQFDVVVGRTAHEVVQVRSILYPFGVHVVRTITLTRSANGYAFRSDSGWKAESDGFYDFSYTVNLKAFGTKFVPNPYEFHKQPVKRVSRVREIRDFPAGGAFTSSFTLSDPDLPPVLKGLSLAEWQQLFANATSMNHTLNVHMQAVVFDADVHLDHVVSGGTSSGGEFTVQSRKMLGYVQLAPSSVVVPARTFGDLLRFQNGSLGGPVDCIIDVANSKQRMRLSRVDVNPARNAAGQDVFVTAARGSLILPGDGAWSVVKRQTNTGDVKPVEQGESVPLIKPNANPNFLVAHPADVYQPASNTSYGVLQSTGTQKLLFDGPQFSPGVAKLKSAQTYFADAYKLLNSKGVFPNVANALGLTNAEKEVEILGEGLMKMADRTVNLGTLLPPNYQYAFINEPGVLKIYAEYRSTDSTSGSLALGIDSAAALADRWKAALSNMRVVVDLGPFDHLMWVDGKFDAASGIQTKYDKPRLQFGPVLDPVVEILQILATLSGDDFDKGMEVGMSNSPDNWEYKFNCSKEIPVIKFPSPLQLTLNPNPPLKLEAGLKVGFYFNQMLSIPTDLKQLVPACGAYVEFYGRLQVQCFTLAVASVYGVGQATLGIAADTKAGITLRMRFGFGAEVVVGLPVVANVSVLYVVEVEADISETTLHVAGLLLFRGSAEICGGLVAIAIQIEAGGSVHRDATGAFLTAQVTFSIDVCVLWVIDIDVTEHWEESRQIA